jgi:cytochrome c oxidase subunit 1
MGIFDPAKGGDPILYQHFFWFYSHPAVYIMILPAMGVISEVISTFSHKHIFGYSFIAFSSVAIALLGFLVWGHHMFVSGQSNVAGAIFSVITFAVSIPSAIKVFNWLATMYNGSIELKRPCSMRCRSSGCSPSAG